jgi:hypothetical protein
MFTGVLVALTVHSAAKAFEKHVARQTIMKLEEKIKL